MSDEKTRQPSGSGEGTYYRLEARSVYTPKVLENGTGNHLVLTDKWSEISTHPHWGNVRNIANVVPNSTHHVLAHDQGLLTYEAARAIERIFIAQVGWGESIETRLVQIKFKYSWLTEFEGYTEPVSTFEESRSLRTAIRDSAKAETKEQ